MFFHLVRKYDKYLDFSILNPFSKQRKFFILNHFSKYPLRNPEKPTPKKSKNSFCFFYPR